MSNDRPARWWENRRMNVDRFRLFLAILWGAVTLYFFLTLFPPLLRFHQWQEVRFKNIKPQPVRPPTWLQRFVFILLASLLTFQLFAGAFHQSLAKITGVSPATLVLLMPVLSALYFIIGIAQKKNRKEN
jgi:drug/metabolite transporter (DMT)-like permease